MNRKPSLLVVFLTVFIDLIGFGIVVPLVPIFSRHYGASGWVIGAIIASFSAMQFVFSPIWGRLSDRHGRRPILLISTAGAALSYVLFAVGSGFGKSYHRALGDARLPHLRRHLRRQHHRRPGLHRRHHAAGKPVETDGTHRHGVRTGIHFRSGAQRHCPAFLRRHRSRLDSRRTLRGEFSPRVLRFSPKV